MLVIMYRLTILMDELKLKYAVLHRAGGAPGAVAVGE
jgi:hypothetical protein